MREAASRGFGLTGLPPVEPIDHAQTTQQEDAQKAGSAKGSPNNSGWGTTGWGNSGSDNQGNGTSFEFDTDLVADYHEAGGWGESKANHPSPINFDSWNTNREKFCRSAFTHLSTLGIHGFAVC